MRIGRLLNTTPESWLRMQEALGLWKVRQHLEKLAPALPAANTLSLVPILVTNRFESISASGQTGYPEPPGKLVCVMRRAGSTPLPLTAPGCVGLGSGSLRLRISTGQRQRCVHTGETANPSCRRSLWLGKRLWEWSAHIRASFEPRKHGVLHLMDRLFRCLAECRTAGQVGGDGDVTLVGIAPKHFHEILTYARHISLPFRQVVWLDKA